jgi:hypothetical protein
MQCTTYAQDAGTPQVFPVTTPISPVGAHVQEFDLVPVGNDVPLIWVGDNAMWSGTQQLSSGFIGTTYASQIVAAPGGPGGLILVVATGAPAVTAQLVDGAGPKGSALSVGSGPAGPPFVGAAWSSSTALIAWSSYSAWFFRRLASDGTWLDAAPVEVDFAASTFTPPVSVASDGTDWLVAVSSYQSALYRVTAAGAVSHVRDLNGYVAQVELVFTGCSYLMVGSANASGDIDVAQVSALGAPIGSSHTLSSPAPAEMGIVSVDVACNALGCFVAAARIDRVDGYWLDLTGVPHGDPIPIDATQGNGEAVAVAPGADGRWLVAWGTWNTSESSPFFGPMHASWVQAGP